MKYRVWTYREGVGREVPSETTEAEEFESIIPAIDRVMELLKPGGIISEEDVIRVKAIVLASLDRSQNGQHSYHTAYRTQVSGFPRMMHVLAEEFTPGQVHPLDIEPE